MDSNAINLSNLYVRFGRHTIFDDAQFTARRGDVVGLIGPNGSGKSTLIGVLAGLVIPGKVNGNILDVALPARSLPRCGLMLENPPFLDSRTGLDNLLELGRLSGLSFETCHGHAVALMKRVGLDPQNRTRVRSYSQGMRKRLALAQAILGNPPIYLLDEPMNGLDPLGMAMMRQTILRLSQMGSIVIVSSHLLDELDKICNRAYACKDKKTIPLSLEGSRVTSLEGCYDEIFSECA